MCIYRVVLAHERDTNSEKEKLKSGDQIERSGVGAVGGGGGLGGVTLGIFQRQKQQDLLMDWTEEIQGGQVERIFPRN